MLMGILQCVYEDDITKYKQIIRGWINTLEDSDIANGTYGAEHPPCSCRYFMMTLIQRGFAVESSGKTAAALRPETDLDTREIALWLNCLLNRIHREVC
jgi:hypothetical protein